LRNWKYWVMRKTKPARAKKMTRAIAGSGGRSALATPVLVSHMTLSPRLFRDLRLCGRTRRIMIVSDMTGTITRLVADRSLARLR
jgi:hypothetical protein